MIIISMFLEQSLMAQTIPCKELPTNAELMNRLANKPVDPGFLYEYSVKCNITDSLKERLIYLLHWEWTNIEVENYLKADLKKHSKIYLIEKKARRVSKQNDSLFRIASDSIQNIVKAQTFKEMEQYSLFTVPVNLIKISALLNLKRAIPILETGLNDPKHYDSLATELALGRLGNKKLQKKIIASCEYNSELVNDFKDTYFTEIAPKLLFISTQESIYKLNEWLDTNRVFSIVADDKPNTKSAYIVIADLKKIILNEDFQKGTDNLPIYWEQAAGLMDNTPILFCKNWLIQNKGKYKINKDYWPSF